MSADVDGVIEAPGLLKEFFLDWQIVMSRDKCVESDTRGVYADYPSHAACVRKVEQLIDGTEIGYYQRISCAQGAIAIETILTHTCGETLATGPIVIPVMKQDAVGIASAIGWAKRLSLVHAFSLGTLERNDSEPKEVRPEPKPFTGIHNQLEGD